MPLVRLDLVVLCVRDERLHVLLGQRKQAPFKGRWGLPGGVLRIDQDPTLEAAAHRVAGERLGLRLPNLSQVVSVGGAQRDPRADWAMTVVYRSLVQPFLPAVPGKRIGALEWRPAGDMASSLELAFDHARLIQLALQAVRQEVEDMRFPPGWLDEPFTLGDLHALSEQVLERRVDKVTFRRRIAAMGVVTELPGQMRQGGAHRPAHLYALVQ